jgi:hypothetical protein
MPTHAKAQAVESTARVAGLENEDNHCVLLLDVRGLPLEQPMPRIKPELQVFCFRVRDLQNTSAVSVVSR